MQSKTVSDNEIKRQPSATVKTKTSGMAAQPSESKRLTRDDRFGMFEAGLQELSAGFTFEAENVEGGVRLTILGIERITGDDGSWSLRIKPDAPAQ